MSDISPATPVDMEAVEALGKQTAQESEQGLSLITGTVQHFMNGFHSARNGMPSAGLTGPRPGKSIGTGSGARAITTGL